MEWEGDLHKKTHIQRGCGVNIASLDQDAHKEDS